jgi:predicted nucleotidyltransferase
MDVELMIELIEQNRREIEALCRKYRVKRLELFGSAARGEFDAARSDIDFFYEFDATDMLDLADRFFGLKEELEKLLGVHVDLVSAPDVKNPYFLQVANRHRQTLYAA